MKDLDELRGEIEELNNPLINEKKNEILKSLKILYGNNEYYWNAEKEIKVLLADDELIRRFNKLKNIPSSEVSLTLDKVNKILIEQLFLKQAHDAAQKKEEEAREKANRKLSIIQGLCQLHFGSLLPEIENKLIEKTELKSDYLFFKKKCQVLAEKIMNYADSQNSPSRIPPDVKKNNTKFNLDLDDKYLLVILPPLLKEEIEHLVKRGVELKQQFPSSQRNPRMGR